MLSTLMLFLSLFIFQGVYRNWEVYIGKRTEYDALPEHLNEQTEINQAFPDDSQYKGLFGKVFKRVKKTIKPWLAFGPRSRFWFARFQSTPTLLWAKKGKGYWRSENDKDEIESHSTVIVKMNPTYYVSRVQYWCKWHIAIQYPLFISFHRFDRLQDVISFPEHGELKGWMGYIGMKRDADGVYWLAAYVGKEFK